MSKLLNENDLTGNTEKVTPVSADTIIIADSEDSNSLKKVQVGNLSGSGTSSPLTTKGDVYIYSTTDARLPVGTDDYVLTADSAEATGLKWASISSSGDVSKVGTPVNDQIGVWTGDGTIEGTTGLTYSSTSFLCSTNTSQSFEVDGMAQLDLSDSGIRLGGANSRVQAIYDTDAMTENSSSALATQQSIKTYADTKINSTIFTGTFEGWGATDIYASVGHWSGQGDEIDAQNIMPVDGTWSDMHMIVQYNDSTSAFTIKSRINGVTGNMSVSVPAGTTGTYSDTTNTDSVSAGDKINYIESALSSSAETFVFNSSLYLIT